MPDLPNFMKPRHELDVYHEKYARLQAIANAGETQGPKRRSDESVESAERVSPKESLKVLLKSEMCPKV